METSLIKITEYLLTQSWQIAILVVVIAAVNFALRNKSAHVRYLCWLIVIAKCLAPPLLTIPLAILPQEQAEFSPKFSSAVALPLKGDVTEESMAESSDLRSIPIGMMQPAIIERGGRNVSIPEWLAIGWIVGFGAFLVFNLLRALRANLWLWRRRRLLPAELRNNIEKVFSTHNIKCFPKIWLVEGFNQPFVWGLVRGSIYLPINFLNINRPEHQRSVLGHELSHVLRFDAAVNILQVIAQGIFWFHPFVWWANRRIRAEREKCCDEMAVAQLNTLPRDYSTAILETLAARHEQTRPVPSLAVAGPVKNIEERIKTMLRPGKKFYKRPSLIAATIVLLLALLTVPTALVLSARAETNAKAPPLHQAVQDNDIRAIKRMLAQGVDINTKDDMGHTVLHVAAEYGHLELAQLLIDKGADIHVKSSWENTPLHMAASVGSTAIAKLLITKGADIEARQCHGGTPLKFACTNGNTEIVRLLIAQGADVNSKNEWGSVPIRRAAWGGA